MSNSLWSTLKKNGINLVPICPSNPLLHPSVHGYPIKKCILISFTSRLSKKKKNKRKEEIYLSRTVRVLFRNFHVLLLLLWLAMELMVFFCLFWLVLFLMLSSTFILFIIILIYMHVKKVRLVIHPAIHSFVVHLLYHLSTFLSNLNAGLE